MNIIKYETPLTKVNWNLPSVFLAGPTVRGNQTHLKSWRRNAIKLFKAKGFDGNVIVPEFTCNTESDKYRYDVPVWEFEGLQKSNVILFWIPRTKELIGLTTNYELGYWVARERDKIVYGRPDDAYRITYCDIMWVEDCKRRGLQTIYAPIYNTLEKTVNAAFKKMTVRKHDQNVEQIIERSIDQIWKNCRENTAKMGPLDEADQCTCGEKHCVCWHNEK